MSTQYTSFRDFYPFYLSEHRDRNCRRLHFAGSLAGIVCLVLAVVLWNPWFILIGLIAGYLFAWIGHFFFEHNRPATFSHPLYSFMGDWVMFKDVCLGRVRI